MSEQRHTTDESHVPSTAEMYGRRLDAVHCLLIPVYGESLLLPNAAVAEVVGYFEPEAVADAPDWLLGRITWRDRRIPLLSFELASGGQSAPPQKNSRIAVLNTLNGNASVSHFGIVTQGIPHLQIVQERHIIRDEEPADPRQSVADYVKLRDESVLVPDIDDLEQRLVRLQATPVLS